MNTYKLPLQKHRKKKKESFPPWKSIVQWPDKKEKFRLEHSFILDGNAIDNLQVFVQICIVNISLSFIF